MLQPYIEIRKTQDFVINTPLITHVIWGLQVYALKYQSLLNENLTLSLQDVREDSPSDHDC